jgi:uncharacterized protein YutE (UPF0331/DUF86 family)
MRAKIIAERISWIRGMLEHIRALPLDSLDSFLSDPRNVAAAESYLRRGLEALLDLGRHVLAKGFGQPVVEYKEIGLFLVTSKVLAPEQGELLRVLAGYRNRMVHFYHEISSRELYEISALRLKDIDGLLEAILEWIRIHPEMMDEAL